MNKGFSKITILAGVVIVIAIAGFLFLQQRSDAPSTTSQQPILTNDQSAPVATSDLCVVEKDKIIALINIFENSQMNREKGAAQTVLALFTSPENPGDSSTYVHLSGSDAAGPRLYSNGKTDFKQPSFKILEGPSKNASGSCTTKVEEQRSYYPHGVGGDFGPVQPYVVYFVSVKQDNAWKMDSYLSDNGSTHKYSGWGY